MGRHKDCIQQHIRLASRYQKTTQSKAWISEEVLDLCGERNKLKLEKLADPSKRPKYNYLNREIKRKCKGCKDKWFKDQCSDIEKAHEASKSKTVYSTIKNITGKTTVRMQTVKSKDGKILIENEDVKHRCKENYHELYNNQNPINEQATATIPQMPNMDEEPPIMREEVANAKRKNVADGKAPGFDCVTGEELKASGEAGIDILHKLCNKIWDTETFPEDWGRAIITPPIFKKKDKIDCNNY